VSRTDRRSPWVWHANRTTILVGLERSRLRRPPILYRELCGLPPCTQLPPSRMAKIIPRIFPDHGRWSLPTVRFSGRTYPQVGADRASVMRCRRSVLSAVGCCCCCHRCCCLCPVAGVWPGRGCARGAISILARGAATTRTVQEMARVRSGQAPAWPLSSARSARRGSGVKRDLACAFTRRLSPVSLSCGHGHA
jgi:hypothetical protein